MDGTMEREIITFNIYFMAYLYKHIRTDTNEVFYIGIGEDKINETNLFKRAYVTYDRNKYWKNIINKTDYKIEIILNNLSWEEACSKEIEYIKIYGRKDLGLGTLVNMTDGGDGTKGYKHTIENKLKRSLHMKNRIISKETREKMSNSRKGKSPGNKGKKTSDEIKQKLSIIKKGKPTPWLRTVVLSEESKRRMSRKGQKCTEEFIIKMRSISPKKKKVLCVDTGIIYESVQEAFRLLKIYHISEVCNGQRQKAGGFNFEYVD